jgi:hypothetical protein
MRETIIVVGGREHRLVGREESEPSGGGAWVRALIDDPGQQHVVHLLVGALVGAVPGAGWDELCARLACELERSFACEPIVETSGEVEIPVEARATVAA